MEDLAWFAVDKSGWGDGPWQDEPDKAQFNDARTGLACLMVRNRYGAWCGYVGVPPGHPWHGVSYHDVQAFVHGGGVTYSAECQAGPEYATICHAPSLGEADNLWWLGFHCCGAGDYAPASSLNEILLREALLSRDDYRDTGYVRQQCAVLALQAAAARMPA